MTNQQTQNSDKANRNQTIALLLPCVLIGHFLWNVLTPAHEFPMHSVQVMTMTFDFLMLVGLFGLKASMPKPMFWIALVSCAMAGCTPAGVWRVPRIVFRQAARVRCCCVRNAQVAAREGRGQV